MDKETRREQLENIKKDQANVAMTGIPLRYKGEIRLETVYRIPLEFLIYNKYNGRIASEVYSYQRQHGVLNPENDEDKRIIEKFLYNSKENRNNKTKKDIEEIGQQRHGIVTADGVVVDGNRRFMLLNKLYEEHKVTGKDWEKYGYFLAIILPTNANERDIQQLETEYQMGEDDKLDYNPIQKYLKCKDLKQLDYNEKQIAEMMNETESEIKKWLDTLKVMEDYLNIYGYDGVYTCLEGREDQFLQLTAWLKYYKKAGNIEWDYDDFDVDDLKEICFDYIRAKYEGKEFRIIAAPGKNNGIFANELLWKDFFKAHKDITDSYQEKVLDELRQENPQIELTQLFNDRDIQWSKGIKEYLENNLQNSSRKLDDYKLANKPNQLAERALSALKSIENKDAINKDINTKKMFGAIGSIIINSVDDPSILIKQAYDSISRIDIENSIIDSNNLNLLENISQKVNKLLQRLKNDNN